MSLRKVLDDNFCVGCGACKAVLGDNVEIKIQDDGFYKARTVNTIPTAKLVEAESTCPFSESSEDLIGKELYGDLDHSKLIGFYRSVSTGYVNNLSSRLESSSGGLTTWFAGKLLENGHIDAIIHVGGNDKDIFNYKISRSMQELHSPSSKKSRYFPVSFEHLVEYIKDTDEKLLFIGIPCYVKAIRQLQRTFKLQNIRFVFALVCGHMKSKGFAESYSWQLGIEPQDLSSIDFRVKKPGFEASDYFVEATSVDGKVKSARNKSLLSSNWGHGHFKHKACDFCDDLAGELADATFGDAWLDSAISDYKGTNIFISRNETLEALLCEFNSEVTFEKASVEDFYNSQSANYRHRRDGLSYRIAAHNGWYPPKRLGLSRPVTNIKRQKLYVFRQTLSRLSNIIFMKAKYKKNYQYFSVRMKLLEVYYDYLNLGVKSLLKKYVWRKG